MWPAIVWSGAPQLIVERSNVPLSFRDDPSDHVLETSRVTLPVAPAGNVWVSVAV